MSSKLKKHLPDAVENDSRTVMTVNKKCKKKTCLSDAESHQHAFGPVSLFVGCPSVMLRNNVLDHLRLDWCFFFYFILLVNSLPLQFKKLTLLAFYFSKPNPPNLDVNAALMPNVFAHTNVHSLSIFVI